MNFNDLRKVIYYKEDVIVYLGDEMKNKIFEGHLNNLHTQYNELEVWRVYPSWDCLNSIDVLVIVLKGNQKI